MVTVIVGPAEKSYAVHEKLLRSASNYFEAALSRDWKEANEKTVKLDDVDPYFFEVFLAWLYNRHFSAYPGKTTAEGQQRDEWRASPGMVREQISVRSTVISC